MTAAHDYSDMHRLIDELAPDQVSELRKHALRLVSANPRRFVPWSELKRGAARLPPVNYARFRADVDAALDHEALLGDER